MTGFALEELSLQRLKGVHPDLQGVVKRAIQLSETDFMVVEGVRDVGRQKQLVEQGKSTTMNSRHLTGHAVDLAAIGETGLVWGAPQHDQIAAAMKSAAAEKGVDLEWGGDWESFVDTPHFQLAWKSYPKQETWGAEPNTKEVKADLSKNSSKYKTASTVKKVAVSTFSLAGILELVKSFGGDVAEAAGNVQIAQIVDLMNQLNAIIQDAWVGLMAAGLMATYWVADWFQKRQVKEVQKGTYTPSGGNF